MNAFLTELGKNLAGRWAAALAVPAAVFVAVVVVAVVLGPAHALDFALLRSRVTTVSTGPALVWAGVGFLAATTLAGLAVTALGGAVVTAWGAAGTGPGRPFTALRRRRERGGEQGVDVAGVLEGLDHRSDVVVHAQPPAQSRSR